MATRLLEFGLARQVATGLVWSVVDQPDAKTAVKQVSGKAYAVVTSGTTNEVAVGDDVDGVVAPGKAYCGAALVAAYAQSAFVYQSIGSSIGGEELVWVCGIQHGIPVPGYEAVLVPSEARQKYSEFASFADDILIVGTLDEAKITLEQVLEKLETKVVKATALKAAGLQLGQALIGVVVFAGLVSAFVFYQHLEEKRQREKLSYEQMLRKEAATAAEKRRLEELRRAFEEKVAVKRQELAAQRDPAVVVDQWLDFIAHEVPVSVKGWQPLRANCRVDGCTVFWRPSPTALPIDGRALPGSLQSWAINEVSTKFLLKAPSPAVRVGADSEFRYRLLSIAGVSAGTANVMQAPEPSPVVVSPPADLKDVQPVTLGTVGSFKASFTNLLAVREFLTLIRPYAVEVDQFEATAFAPNVGSPGWSLEGRYVVRN